MSLCLNPFPLKGWASSKIIYGGKYAALLAGHRCPDSPVPSVIANDNPEDCMTLLPLREHFLAFQHHLYSHKSTGSSVLSFLFFLILKSITNSQSTEVRDVLYLRRLKGYSVSLNVSKMFSMPGILLTIHRPLGKYVSFTTIS